MGLIKPRGPDWGFCSHNLPAPPSSTTLGISCTPGLSSADGSAAALLGALAHDVEYIRLMFSLDTSVSQSALNNTIMANILIDPAGGTSWATLIPELVLGYMNQAPTTGAAGGAFSATFDFPLWIPAGASLGIQARCADAASTPILRALVWAYGGNANPASWWAGQRVSAIGTVPAASGGTAHTAGNSGAFSSWTNLGSVLGADCGAVQWAVGGEGDTTASQLSYQFEFGVGSVRVGPPEFKLVSITESGYRIGSGLIFRRLAAGTQLQVRGTCSGTAQSLGVAAYAVH